MTKTPIKILTRDRELTERVCVVNPSNLPPIQGLILKGRPVEQHSREELIAALYILAGENIKLKMEAGL